VIANRPALGHDVLVLSGAPRALAGVADRTGQAAHFAAGWWSEMLLDERCGRLCRLKTPDKAASVASARPHL
jgi:hypothetical protein